MAGIRQFVYLSDVRVYGNHRENPIPITERTQPSPAAEHRFLLEAESEIRQNAGATTLGHDLTIAALRPTMTAGPSGSSPITDDLLWPMIASNRKRSIPIQMLHEQDFARAIQLTMERRLEGAYNLTSKGVIGSEQALEMCRSVMVAKPVGAKRRRGSRGSGFGRHPLIVSDTKFRHAAGFTAKYSPSRPPGPIVIPTFTKSVHSMFAQASSDPMRVVVDTDPGVDDAVAILMLLANPNCDVVGLTTTAGNVPLARSTRNALALLEYAGRLDIPVHQGAARPVRGAMHTLDTFTRHRD